MRDKGVMHVSLAMLNMWISLAGIGFMFIAVLLIMLSRYKLKGVFKWVVAIFAYVLVAASGLIVFYIVLSGPSGI